MYSQKTSPPFHRPDPWHSKKLDPGHLPACSRNCLVTVPKKDVIPVPAEQFVRRRELVGTRKARVTFRNSLSVRIGNTFSANSDW